MNPIVINLLALLVGAGIGGLLVRWKQRATATRAGTVIATAHREADGIIRDAIVRGQDQQLKARADFDTEARTRRNELAEAEKRLLQRETNLDRKVELLDRKT